MEAANQSLADIGMELHQGAVCILSKIHFSNTPFSEVVSYSGHILEMLASFVFDAALGVPSVIARIAVAAATRGKG